MSKPNLVVVNQEEDDEYGYTLTNQRLGEDRLALSRLNNFNKEGEEDEQA